LTARRRAIHGQPCALALSPDRFPGFRHGRVSNRARPKAERSWKRFIAGVAGLVRF
jgi:hypothetical protein